MSIVALRTAQGHTLVGPYGELRSWLATAAAQGRLTADGLLESGVLPDGRCYARVRLLPVRTRRRRLRRGVVVGAAVAVTAVLSLAGWLAVLALAWLVAHVWQIVAVMVLAAIGLVALGRAGVCPGIHCPGCRHS